MKVVPREASGYAVLLVILFCIAALAVWHLMDFLEIRVPPDDFHVVAGALWAITLGFMFVAGAFGLWAVQFSAREESRRRIGRLVNAMDYLQDGLVAVDAHGHLCGSNPAARLVAGCDVRDGLSLAEVFTCLSTEDVDELLLRDEPYELQRRPASGGDSPVLRFRSQPAEGLTLVIVSDVTVMETRRLRNRQAARLQLIGQIARGVAYDLNNLLCAISGHAALLSRLPAESAESTASVRAISRSVDKGSALAGHLLELVNPVSNASYTSMGRDYIVNAVNSLRDSLQDDWDVRAEVQDLPRVAMTALQIEQVVTNLGMLAADAAPEAGVLHIQAGPITGEDEKGAHNRFAGSVLISTLDPATAHGGAVSEDDAYSVGGVILSVIRSMIVEAGGELDALVASSGIRSYCVRLPYATAITGTEKAELPADLGPYIADWTALIGQPQERRTGLETLLRDFGVSVINADDIVSVLARSETAETLDAIIIDKRLIRHEAAGLLRAVLKLRPAAGIVVLCENPTTESEGLAGEIVFVASEALPNEVVLAIIEARSLAMRRKTR